MGIKYTARNRLVRHTILPFVGCLDGLVAKMRLSVPVVGDALLIVKANCIGLYNIMRIPQHQGTWPHR